MMSVLISYGFGKDIWSKPNFIKPKNQNTKTKNFQTKNLLNFVTKFQNVCGNIHRLLKNKTRQATRNNFYKTVTVPIILYGSQPWIHTEKKGGKIQVLMDEQEQIELETSILRRTTN